MPFDDLFALHGLDNEQMKRRLLVSCVTNTPSLFSFRVKIKCFGCSASWANPKISAWADLLLAPSGYVICYSSLFAVPSWAPLQPRQRVNLDHFLFAVAQSIYSNTVQDFGITYRVKIKELGLCVCCKRWW